MLAQPVRTSALMQTSPIAALIARPLAAYVRLRCDGIIATREYSGRARREELPMSTAVSLAAHRLVRIRNGNSGALPPVSMGADACRP